MRLAQQLYEGIDIKGNGTVGVISYLRTDSTRISEEADAAARTYISEQYGLDYVSQTEKAIKEVGDKVDATEKAAVEADVQALKDILAKSAPENTTEEQVAEIKAAKEKLMESAQKLFTKMYEQAGAAAGAQGAGPQPGANAGAGPAPEGFQGDDVVDGDYKEV